MHKTDFLSENTGAKDMLNIWANKFFLVYEFLFKNKWKLKQK